MELKPFFNFKEAGILFYDREKEKFFTIQIDEDQIYHETNVKNKGNHHAIEQTKDELKFDDGNNIENLCPSSKELIFYPSNFGLSGYSFKAGTI